MLAIFLMKETLGIGYQSILEEFNFSSFSFRKERQVKIVQRHDHLLLILQVKSTAIKYCQLHYKSTHVGARQVLVESYNQS